MRCSSFSSLLDEYVDGTLPAARHAALEAHVAQCSECATLLGELRVIDGLLLAPRTLDPAPNFTFAVMADVRSLRLPHARHRISSSVLGSYIVFAWIAIGGFCFFGGASAREVLTSLARAMATGARGTTTLTSAVGFVFGSHTLGVTAAMGALLGFDLLLAALVYAFMLLRARRRVERSID